MADIGQIFASERGVPHFSALTAAESIGVCSTTFT